MTVHSFDDFDPDDLAEGDLPAGFHVVDPEDQLLDDDPFAIYPEETDTWPWNT